MAAFTVCAAAIAPVNTVSVRATRRPTAVSARARVTGNHANTFPIFARARFISSKHLTALTGHATVQVVCKAAEPRAAAFTESAKMNCDDCDSVVLDNNTDAIAGECAVLSAKKSKCVHPE
eukprot:7090841-Pyramimonas_sp.AAC.1